MAVWVWTCCLCSLTLACSKPIYYSKHRFIDLLRYKNDYSSLIVQEWRERPRMGKGFRMAQASKNGERITNGASAQEWGKDYNCTMRTSQWIEIGVRLGWPPKPDNKLHDAEVVRQSVCTCRALFHLTQP